MTGLFSLMTVLFVTLGLASAQTPICHGKPTEKVAIQYERLVAKGES
jgi:hypothetical protein